MSLLMNNRFQRFVRIGAKVRKNDTKQPRSLFIREFGSSSTDTQNNQEGLVLGILRETYDPWERRVPLCPTHVQQLLQCFRPTSDDSKEQNSLLKNILVQPSKRRIYKDDEYRKAGATLSDDLSTADLILGVKRPQTTDQLHPNKAYMFFSHVIKGQSENMGLLQHILQNNIQLFDYECITDPHTNKRLVAFGKFAGLAGTTDTFQVLGRRLLAQGFSTPFLNCPPTHMHYDWNEVVQSLKSMGEHIIKGELKDIDPIVYCFTGKGGNVASGAVEAFENLPHKWVRLQDLPLLKRKHGPHTCIYGVQLGPEDVFRHRDGRPFGRSHYMKHPAEYESVFATDVAPYITVLVNGMYWDERYPRMLTKQQMHDLYGRGEKSLMVVADISCDVNGSIEFLLRSTTIDHPTFHYDPILQRETSQSAEGITICGVDILPTELPRESSAYFGDQLLPVLEEYIRLKGSGDADALPKQLVGALITKDGSLTHAFKHLGAFMDRDTGADVSSPAADVVLLMKGHIFDSGLINQLLDAMENNDCRFDIIECHVGPKENGTPTKSSLALHIAANDSESLSVVQKKIENLTKAIETADASIEYINHDGPSIKSETKIDASAVEVTDMPKEETVLLLGSGMVSKSFASYIGRDARRSLVVASVEMEESKAVASAATNGEAVQLDVLQEGDRLADLVAKADIVVSLLPATMHGLVAKECIAQSTNMVTASYESDEIRELDKRAQDAGIVILNEVGLDPGLDHMSAMRIIDDVRARYGTITGFSSVCGGLPAPDSANNPLKYKFSWSPMGVLAASQNDAKFRLDGETVMVNGRELLLSAKPFHLAWSSLGLECLPNRDSLVYGDIYGIQDADTIFRGTLRYGGFSRLMAALREMGLFEKQGVDAAASWSKALDNLRKRNSACSDLDDFVLQCSGGNPDIARAVQGCLNFLNMTKETPLSNPDSIIESFCKALEAKCQYGVKEHDMVLMHHDIKATFPDGSHEHHQSKLQLLGDSEMSAMAKTVGYTAAAATDLLLRIYPPEFRGSIRPINRSLYEPILKAMEEEGIAFSESVQVDESPIAGHVD